MLGNDIMLYLHNFLRELVDFFPRPLESRLHGVSESPVDEHMAIGAGEARGVCSLGYGQ